MIPVSADQLDPAWFSAVIGNGATCTTVDQQPLGVGVGLVGQLFACDLTWDREGPPARVIAKLAALGEESRFVATVLNMYGREVGFYRELADHTPTRVPECFHAQHDPATQDTVLLLEDVSACGVQIDQVQGATLDAVQPAIAALAELHSAWWESPRLSNAPWLLRLCDDPYPGAVQMAVAAGWPVVQEYMADLITPAVRSLGDRLVEMIPAIFAKLCEGPLTLSHADWRLDNLFLGEGGAVTAVDWQLIDRSVAPRDLAYLVTQSLECRDGSEYRTALDSYLDALRANGIEVDSDWAWEMYRQATRFGLVYPIIAGGSLTVADPRHLELCRALMRRCVRALEDLDAIDLPL